jgi:murein DD-endopeptidase MepM/ murein hydrolase activator NlpD
LSWALQHAQQHRRALVGIVFTLLAGTGITAFGIAPFAPDASELPRRMVEQAIAPGDLNAQLEALAAATLPLIRNDTTRPGDTAETLLRRLGVNDKAAADFLRRDAVARLLLEGRAGKLVQVEADEDGRLLGLVARFPAMKPELVDTHFSRLRVERGERGLQAWMDTAPLKAQTRLGSGTISTSLFAAIDESGLPDAVAGQLAEMFAAEIDFHRDLRRGDTFSIVYEAMTADGEPIPWNAGRGRVLAAEFVNDGKAHQAMWWRDATGRGAYFGFDGQSKRRAFLASPMEFSRMTSGFAMRLHPIHQTWRQHLGVDYAAPVGTPVRTVGAGVVEFAGVQNGYGNVVQIRHGSNRSTLYAHLSRVDVRKGQAVEQGQRIGAVGATGWATGPHLHFEFRVGLQHVDPQRIAREAETVAISPATRPQFLAQASGARSQLQTARNVGAARSHAD